MLDSMSVQVRPTTGGLRTDGNLLSSLWRLYTAPGKVLQDLRRTGRHSAPKVEETSWGRRSKSGDAGVAIAAGPPMRSAPPQAPPVPLRLPAAPLLTAPTRPRDGVHARPSWSVGAPFDGSGWSVAVAYRPLMVPIRWVDSATLAISAAWAALAIWVDWIQWRATGMRRSS